MGGARSLAAAGRPARRRGPRPRRGQPEETRARLLDAAAAVFNRHGYHGTDSNRLARAAGYAPPTFYKHFPDKRAIFLAVYERWVTAEWAAVGAVVGAGGPRAALAARLVELAVALHRRWRGLRASLRALVAADPVARAFYRAQRRRQLRMLAELGRGASRRSAAEGAILLFTLERVCDALADGEVADLGLERDAVQAALRGAVERYLGV
jgi:AcrR family transcriptional regulator